MKNYVGSVNPWRKLLGPVTWKLNPLSYPRRRQCLKPDHYYFNMENLGGVGVCIFYLLTSVPSTDEIFITPVAWATAGKCLRSAWLSAAQSILITVQSERITVLLWCSVWKEGSKQKPVILQRDFMILADIF